jgi:hypothetical protein
MRIRRRRLGSLCGAGSLMILYYLRVDRGDGGAWRPKRAGCGLGPVLEATLLMAGSGACAGRKLGYRFWPGLSRGGPVLVEQSAQTLSASDLVDLGRERDHVRCVFGGRQKHSVALVGAPGVVMGDVDVEHVV